MTAGGRSAGRAGGLSTVLRVVVVWLLTAGALHLMSAILPGFVIEGEGSALVAAAAIGLVNALVWPLADPRRAAVHGAHARAGGPRPQRPRRLRDLADRAGDAREQRRGGDRGGDRRSRSSTRWRRRCWRSTTTTSTTATSSSAKRAATGRRGGRDRRARRLLPRDRRARPRGGAARHPRRAPADARELDPGRRAHAAALGDRLVVADRGLPGGPAARVERGHARVPLVGEGPRASRSSRTTPRTPPRSSAATPTARGCCTRTAPAARTSSPATRRTPC